MLDKIPAAKLRLLAIILVACYPLAIIAARLDIMHFRNSFLIFIVAALVGFFVLVLALLKMPRKSQSESSALVLTVILTVAPLLVLGSNIVKARSVPFIHDVTTDTQNPPLLAAAKLARSEGDHPVEYEGEAVAALQLEGYPDIKTLELDQTVDVVLANAQALVDELGWKVLAVNTEQSPFTIEAVDESLLFGFKDDIVIRMEAFTTPEQHVDVPAKTRVDVRSMSRVGKSDLGANAERIQTVLEGLKNNQ